mmetsp:Transcript_5874/g.24927  ORF Transcript_5874/g.24927 Transcript_5874/m.24927 type:complete len:223 (+) Transcript_5874:3217-3885(+)
MPDRPPPAFVSEPPASRARAFGSKASRTKSTADAARLATRLSTACFSSPRLWNTCSAAPTSAWLALAMPWSSATPARRRVSRAASFSQRLSRSTTSTPEKSSSPAPSRLSSSMSPRVFAAFARSPAAAAEARRRRSASTRRDASLSFDSFDCPFDRLGFSEASPAESLSSTRSAARSLALSLDARTTRRSKSTVRVRFSSCLVLASTAVCGSTISSRTLPMV